MDKAVRHRERRAIKTGHDRYLDAVAGTPGFTTIQRRFARLAIDIRDLLRATPGSENALKAVPSIARNIFGLREDMGRFHLPWYPFTGELDLLNTTIISGLDRRRSTAYGGTCASYGETLFNCYLDVLITLTVLKTPREIGAKPTFLVYPPTGSVLELDVMLEGFRLAFEFQGEHHYGLGENAAKVAAKDAFKLAECPQHGRLLIPVNPSQLQSDTLARLILNSLKDHLGLASLFADPPSLAVHAPSSKRLTSFCKAAQRMYLACTLFGPARQWLDAQANTYVANTARRSPISTSIPAPRLVPEIADLEVEGIYKRLPAVARFRKGKPPTLPSPPARS